MGAPAPDPDGREATTGSGGPAVAVARSKHGRWAVEEPDSGAFTAHQALWTA